MSSVLTSLSTSRKSMRGNYRASAASPMQFSSRKDILHSTLRRASKQAIASRLRLLPSCSAQSAMRNVAPVPPRPVGSQTPAVRRKISPQMVHANLRKRERHLEPRRRGLPSRRKTDRYLIHSARRHLAHIKPPAIRILADNAHVTGTCVADLRFECGGNNAVRNHEHSQCIPISQFHDDPIHHLPKQPHIDADTKIFVSAIRVPCSSPSSSSSFSPGRTPVKTIPMSL